MNSFELKSSGRLIAGFISLDDNTDIFSIVGQIDGILWGNVKCSNTVTIQRSCGGKYYVLVHEAKKVENIGSLSRDISFFVKIFKSLYNVAVIEL